MIIDSPPIAPLQRVRTFGLLTGGSTTAVVGMLGSDGLGGAGTGASFSLFLEDFALRLRLRRPVMSSLMESCAAESAARFGGRLGLLPFGAC